jgi:hypothetical protein
MGPVDQQVELLKKQKYYSKAAVEHRADGSALVTISDFPVPPGWNKSSTTIVFVAPAGYPQARPDCFWADEDLRLANGGMPANSAINTGYGGPAPKLWFSYHPSSWNANLDTLFNYVKLIRQRLIDAR